ncbi:MAG: hypothetical protein N7Q72_02750 [Spiroplasma sp. Tabriz.8]|nr:hypothetical protein [Spiroplasma sp. Tabriz.8]
MIKYEKTNIYIYIYIYIMKHLITYHCYINILYRRIKLFKKIANKLIYFN